MINLKTKCMLRKNNSFNMHRSFCCKFFDYDYGLNLSSVIMEASHSKIEKQSFVVFDM